MTWHLVCFPVLLGVLRPSRCLCRPGGRHGNQIPGPSLCRVPSGQMATVLTWARTGLRTEAGAHGEGFLSSGEVTEPGCFPLERRGARPDQTNTKATSAWICPPVMEGRPVRLLLLSGEKMWTIQHHRPAPGAPEAPAPSLSAASAIPQCVLQLFR